MIRTVLVGVLVVGLVATPAVVAAVEDPNFRVWVPEPTLTPGTTAELTVQLQNDADEADERVATARNVEVALSGGDTPITVESGPRLVGDFPDGALEDVSFRVRVPNDIPGGTYRLPLTVEYEHDGETDSQTVHAVVRIEKRPRFRVLSTESDAPVGGTGTLTLRVKNVGSETAYDSVVTLESQNADVTFGGGQVSRQYAAEWPPGGTRTLSYEVTVAEEADRVSYALTATVSFDDADGDAGTSRPLSLGFVPGPEQTFALRNVKSGLRVGEKGQLVATLVNEGPAAVDNAVLVLEPSGQTVHAVETEYAVGDLAAGSKTRVEFTVEVSSDAAAGPRQFAFHVRYDDGDGDARKSDPLYARADVAEKRAVFGVRPVDAELQAGSDATITLEVTNRGERQVTDVSAKLFADDPISASDDEAFIERLGPGESTRITFEVSAAKGATAKTYPVSLDFQYDDADGDTQLSDTFRVPVRVTARRRGEGLSLIGGVVLLVVLAVGGYAFRERLAGLFG